MSKTTKNNQGNARIITIYNAQLKKNISYRLKLSDFKNEKDRDNYIAKLRKKQKKENRLFRQKLQVDKYKDPSTLIKTNMEKQTSSDIEKPILKNAFSNIEILDDLKLDISTKTGQTMCILGSGQVGKTTRMMEIYKQYYEPNKNIISTLFSINSHIKLYSGHKNLLRYNGFDKNAEKYIKLQKYINSKTKNNYFFLSLIDDVIDAKYKNILNEMILTYRNSNISTIICLQYGYLLSKMNRANVNRILIFKSNSAESIKDLINTFLKPYFIRLGVRNYDDQVNLFKYVTENRGFFYINNFKDEMTCHRILI